MRPQKGSSLVGVRTPKSATSAARSARREVLDSIIEAIEGGELDGILVPKLDRLSRLAPRDRVELFDRIESAGGVVKSASESLDVSTPEGRFAREVFLGVARMQWEKYRDGFQVAKENAIENGIAIMARPPFGLRFNKRHGLEPVPGERELVDELFRMRLDGASLGATVLTRFERATGRSSYRETMRYLLANRVYLGELRYGSGDEAMVNLDAVEPIVDAELFAAVQAVNAERGGASRGRSNGKAKSLLAGIARCKGCGRGLTRTRTGSRQTYSYKCPQDTRHCPARAHIQADELDAYVLEAVLDWAGAAADELVELELELEPPADRIVLEHRGSRRGRGEPRRVVGRSRRAGR